MFKKLKYILLVFVFISMVFCGLVVVSSELPQFIKDRSNLKVSFTKKPFDLRFDTGKYIIYINGKIIENIKENTIDVFRSIGRDNPVKNITEFEAQ